MKASIDEHGALTVFPENGTECFALKMWWENYMRGMVYVQSAEGSFVTLCIATTQQDNAAPR
jgi:hypothetical protein